MFHLPRDLVSLIFEFTDQKDQMKRRFSNDVLPLIEKGWHVVGIKNGKKCTRCYMEGDKCGMGCDSDIDICDIVIGGDFDIMSYDEYKQTSEYIPIQESYDYWKTIYHGDDVIIDNYQYFKFQLRGLFLSEAKSLNLFKY
jgi:hypothetical protein